MNICSVSRESMPEVETQYWARIVRETQKYSGMTIPQIADVLGVSERDVAYWKAGERCPRGFIAVRLYQLRASIVSAADAYPAHLFIPRGPVGQ